MNKKYILTRNDEFVCSEVTVEIASDICRHFGTQHDTFKIESQDNKVAKWNHGGRLFGFFYPKD